MTKTLIARPDPTFLLTSPPSKGILTLLENVKSHYRKRTSVSVRPVVSRAPTHLGTDSPALSATLVGVIVAVILGVIVGAICTAPRLQAQPAAELRPREKTERFLRYLVTEGKIDPSAHEHLWLEYETRCALAELAGASDPLGHSFDFIERVLDEIEPEYLKARELTGSGGSAEAERLMRPRFGDSNRYLSAYARRLVAEVRAQNGDFTTARAICEELLANDRDFLIPDWRACEILAQAFRAEEKPLLEHAQLLLLLTDYRDVPLTVTAGARARLAELGPEVGHPLETVSGWMAEVGKLLDDYVTAVDPTGHKEKDIVLALSKLIELQEAIERNRCQICGGSCVPGSCTQKGSVNGGRQPADVSRLPTSGDSNVLLDEVTRASGGSIWGQLRARDAARAIQSLRGKLPVRYEQLLEQYYKALSKEE